MTARTKSALPVIAAEDELPLARETAEEPELSLTDSQETSIEEEQRRLSRASQDSRERKAIQDVEREADFKKQFWNLRDGILNPPANSNPWAFDGQIRKVGGGVIVLDSGQGKTWLMIEIGIDYVTGLPLCGVYPNRNPGPVILFLEEDSKDNTIDRGAQLVRGKRLRGIEEEQLSNLHIINNSGLQLDTPERCRARFRTIVEDIRPVFVGIDPMAEVHTQPENDAQKMLANLLRPIRSMALELGFFCMFSHHTRKAYAGQDSDQKQSGRGSSAIKGWADSAWFIKAVGDVLSVEAKQREGSAEFPAVTNFSLLRVQDPGERAQRWEVSLGVEEDIQARHDAPRVLQAVQRAREILNRDLEKVVRLNGKRLDSALTYLQAAGQLKVEFEVRQSADKKMRKQKIIRSTEEPRSTEDSTEVGLRFISTEEPRSTPIGVTGSEK